MAGTPGKARAATLADVPTLTIHPAGRGAPVAVHPLGSASALAGLLAAVAVHAPGVASALAGWEASGVEIPAAEARRLADDLEGASGRVDGHTGGACRLLAGWLRETPEGGAAVLA